MAIMGTFSSFTGARLAIYASQASLNVTGNNIANVNTKGYTRQRMDLVSLHSTGWPEYRNSYQVDIGYGVLCDQVTQLRDPFLDIRYRDENAELGFYEAKQNAINQLASFLDEVGKGTGDNEGFGVIEKQLGDVFKTLENLKQRVGTEEYDNQFRAACYTLTGLFNDAAKRAETVRDNKADELKQDTKQVNLLLKEIRALNDEIRTQGIVGDNALELRDARNVAIDELSKYLKIDVKYSNEYIDQYTTVEKLSISLADTQPEIKLIDGIYGTQLMMNEQVPKPNPAYDPNLDSSKHYLDANNKPTDCMADALLDTNGDPKLNTQANNPTGGWFGKDGDKNYKYLKPDGTFTDKAEEAEMIPSFSTEDADVDKNSYLFQLEPLVDKDGRYMRGKNGMEIKDVVDINDTTLVSGSLQATREFLTEEGEFASEYDIGIDSTANTKRGVRYYQHVLDSWAQKFAETFNEANQMYPSTIYEMENGKFVDKEGKEITTANGDAIISTKDLVSRGAEKLIKDYSDEELASLQQSGAFLMDPKDAFKVNAKGEFIDSNGEPIKNPASGNVITAAGFSEAAHLDILRKKGVLQEDLKAEEVFKTAADPQTNEKTFQSAAGGNLLTPKEPADYNEAEITALRGNGVLKKEYEYFNGGVLFSNRSDNNDPTGITAKNISIAYAWDNGEVRVPNTKQPDYVDPDTGNVQTSTTANDNILHMLALFDQKLTYEAKNTVADSAATRFFFKGTFQEMYTSISGTLAADGMITNARYENFSLSTLNLDNDRASVSGVDLNEEATSMMQFSKSYSAACRLLTTLDSMLDKLINGTAV